MHASVRRALRQAWELDDAEKAETLIRNLARRLERDWYGVSASILEGIDEMLTVTRLGLPRQLRRLLACTNIIENVMGTVRRVCRNVKYWRSPSMALRWAAAAMQEATKGFRRLKACKHLPALRAALAKQGQQPHSDKALVQIAEAAQISMRNDRFENFNRQRDIAALQDWPCERTESAEKRSSAEGVGCVE